MCLGTYDGIYLVFIDGNTDETFEVLVIGASTGSLDRLGVGCTEGVELWISGGSVFVTTYGTYDGLELGF